MKFGSIHKRRLSLIKLARREFMRDVSRPHRTTITLAPIVTSLFKLFCMIPEFARFHTHKQCQKKRKLKFRLFYEHPIEKCSSYKRDGSEDNGMCDTRKFVLSIC